MWDYSLLEALDAVVNERSFVRAAKRLHITQSAVSQRIKMLENVLGHPVIIRSPVIQPTSIGQHLITHLRQVRLLEHALQDRWPLKKRKVGFQPIGIALNTESLSTWFIDSIKAFLMRENMVVELFIDDQDRTIELLRRGKVWGCITSVAEPPHGCTSTCLGDMVYLLVSSPGFSERFFSKGVNARSLLNAPAAIWGEYDEMQKDYLRRHFRAYGKGNPNHHYVPSPEGLVRFAVEGLAYALLPTLSIEGFMREGRLIPLLPDIPYRLSLYWQTWELQTAETRRLSQAIIDYATTALSSEN